jgi:dihydropyrimidinase
MRTHHILFTVRVVRTLPGLLPTFRRNLSPSHNLLLPNENPSPPSFSCQKVNKHQAYTYFTSIKQHAMTSFLIQNGTVVNADGSRRADVLVENGKILKIADRIPAGHDGVRVIDATGKYILPGGIDPHVHLALTFMEQSSESPASGTRCAIAGGTTTLMDFIIPPPVAEEGILRQTFDKWATKYQQASCNYSFHGCVTKWSESMPQQMKELQETAGLNSFKMFMAYKDALMLDDASLVQGFARCKELGVLPAVHAENGELVSFLQNQIVKKQGITGPEGHPLSRPDRVESEACERAITIASQLNTPLMIVHNTTMGSVQALQRGQADGVRVLGEVTIVHLVLDESRYYQGSWEQRAARVLSPPLRSRTDVDALWRGIDAGILTQVVTDHCAFTTEQKKNGGKGLQDFRSIPNGCPGIEERMPLLWTKGVNTGRITMPQFVALTSTNAAKTYSMYPQKGVLAEGSDADLVIWDPAASTTITAATHQSCLDVNVFEGIALRGLPETVLLNGELVVGSFQIIAEHKGRYVRRQPFAESVYGGLEKRDAVRQQQAAAVKCP